MNDATTPAKDSADAVDVRDLTRGPVSRHMVRLSGFMMLSMLSFTVASLAETLYIGWVGTNPLAAISFTFPVVFTLQGVSMGLGIGASSVVARAAGIGDSASVKRLVTHCIVLGTVISICLAIAAGQVIVPIFTLLGATGAEQ